MHDAFDDLTIGHIKLLLSAADLGSFTQAANASGLSPAAVSKAIMRFEQRLGVPLFLRSTRTMRLTDIGERYVADCREALALLHRAEQAAADAQAEPAGQLRVSLPTPYAHWRLPRLLSAFQARFPHIQVRLHISDRSVSLGNDAFDIAIRGHELADSGMVARKLEDAELVIVAAPEYLARAPAPNRPQDLLQHQCIQFRLPGSGRISTWSYREGGVRKEIATNGNLVCEDEYVGGIALARAGAGIYQMYRFAVEEDLAAGRLIELLPAYGGATRPFYLIYPDGITQPAKLRAFIDFLAETLVKAPRPGKPA